MDFGNPRDRNQPTKDQARADRGRIDPEEVMTSGGLAFECKIITIIKYIGDDTPNKSNKHKSEKETRNNEFGNRDGQRKLVSGAGQGQPKSDFDDFDNHMGDPEESPPLRASIPKKSFVGDEKLYKFVDPSKINTDYNKKKQTEDSEHHFAKKMSEPTNFAAFNRPKNSQQPKPRTRSENLKSDFDNFNNSQPPAGGHIENKNDFDNYFKDFSMPRLAPLPQQQKANFDDFNMQVRLFFLE
jgi:hypothetical protein